MSLDLQFKIKNDVNSLRYLHENSNWYKFLNRDSSNYNFFIEEVKTVYKLRPADRISKALDTFDMIQTLLANLRQEKS